MNRFFTALAALALASGSALAADLPPPVYKAPPPPPPTWTGCDINAGIGYGLWDQTQFQESFPGLARISANVDSGGNGWLGRFGGGCDYQFTLGSLGNFVVGAFGDFDLMNIHGQMSPGDLALVGNENESNAWYAGGRVGYLVTPALLTYFDGGYTQTRFDQINLSLLAAPFSATALSLPAHTYNGWFIGGGTEYALNFSWFPINGLFWRTEYRYASYSAADIPIVGATGAPTVNAVNSEKVVQTVTSSLVWRFNFNGPMVMPH